MLYYSYNALAL